MDDFKLGCCGNNGIHSSKEILKTNNQLNISLNDKSKKYEVRKHFLKEYFKKIPKMESHYCRKSTTKQYLEETYQSKQELYDHYK